ncbi:MAG: methyltransferase domain-containing protein [Bacteroidota bacterium]
MDFASRSRAEELMDDPNLDKKSLEKAYVDINRCNTLLGGTALTIHAIKKIIKKHPKKSYTIYDMGCGDGHMLRKVAETFKEGDFTLHLTGIDQREDVLNIAADASHSYENISFKKADILHLKESKSCDILLCTLTMHHFEEKDILKFVKKFSEITRLAVIINDLERSKLAYRLFQLFSLFFIQTHTAKVDGLISISKGFRKLELMQFAKSLKDVTHKIQWKWAFRYLWIMEPTKRNN